MASDAGAQRGVPLVPSKRTRTLTVPPASSLRMASIGEMTLRVLGCSFSETQYLPWFSQSSRQPQPCQRVEESTSNSSFTPTLDLCLPRASDRSFLWRVQGKATRKPCSNGFGVERRTLDFTQCHTREKFGSVVELRETHEHTRDRQSICTLQAPSLFDRPSIWRCQRLLCAELERGARAPLYLASQRPWNAHLHQLTNLRCFLARFQVEPSERGHGMLEVMSSGRPCCTRWENMMRYSFAILPARQAQFGVQ